MTKSKLTQEDIQAADVTICLKKIEQMKDLSFCTIITNMASYMIKRQGFYGFKHNNSKILIVLKND